MVVASFTQTGKNYDVTVKDGKAIHCTCGDRVYRKRFCKHMENAQWQLDHPETQRLYSEVCGHLVKSNVHRHCGCMA